VKNESDYGQIFGYFASLVRLVNLPGGLYILPMFFIYFLYYFLMVDV